MAGVKRRLSNLVFHELALCSRARNSNDFGTFQLGQLPDERADSSSASRHNKHFPGGGSENLVH